MGRRYLTAAIQQLRNEQLSSTLFQVTLQHAHAAERILRELLAGNTFTFEEIAFRITGRRPTHNSDAQLTSREAVHDLLLFIEDATSTACVHADCAGEKVLTLEELTKRFNVTAKTISRWRPRGLVSRRFVFGSRKRLGFLESSVEWFGVHNAELIRRADCFSQLTETERHAIIEEAQRLSAKGGCRSDILKQVARGTGRSVETIRYTLRQFEQEHPDSTAIPWGNGPLNDKRKEAIYQRYRNGESVESIARNWGRTRTAIYRIISEICAKHIDQQAVDKPPPVGQNEPFPEDSTEKLLRPLNHREKQVVLHRFALAGDHARLTLRQIADRLGVTKQRVRQIEARSIAKLKEYHKGSDFQAVVERLLPELSARTTTMETVTPDLSPSEGSSVLSVPSMRNARAATVSGAENAAIQATNCGADNPETPTEQEDEKPIWQMTRGEFHQLRRCEGQTDPTQINKEFRARIEQAVAEGKEINPAIFADYPDLRAKVKGVAGE